MESNQNSKKGNFQSRRKRENKHIQYHRVIISGFFVGAIVSTFYSSYTLISIFTLSKFFALFAFAGLLIPYKFYKKWFDFKIFEMFLMNIICFGPVLLAIFLVLNFYITSHRHQEIFHIDVVTTYKHLENPLNEIELFYNEKGLKDFSGMRTFEGKEIAASFHATAVSYTFADGIFGFKVEKGHKFLLERKVQAR